jgi:hypothetical protein
MHHGDIGAERAVDREPGTAHGSPARSFGWILGQVALYEALR